MCNHVLSGLNTDMYELLQYYCTVSKRKHVSTIIIGSIIISSFCCETPNIAYLLSSPNVLFMPYILMKFDILIYL